MKKQKKQNEVSGLSLARMELQKKHREEKAKSEETHEENDSMKEIRKDMLEGGAVPNFEGGVYLAEGLWIYPDGSLREF